MLKRVLYRARRGELLRAAGFKLLRWLEKRLQVDSTATYIPLAAADPLYLFSTATGAIRDEERLRMRTAAGVLEGANVEAGYPLVFEHEDRVLRYAYHPARKTSRGLVVVFHGWNSAIQMGPAQPWDEFDILAPWDVFGWRRQGSWYWGDQGDNYTERLVAALIQQVRAQQPGRPWFCYGGSMGGFGALYHGIKYGCDGLYVLCPQVDLRAKVLDYDRENRRNPYGYLQGETLETVPDLLAIARGCESLPPLLLIQNQYDAVNYFADHAFRLLEIYNAQQAWYGLRVFPAIGHQPFSASPAEAEYFFRLILEKQPPRRTTFRP
ncbi:MAG: lysophospholipase, partial [Anaerolineae bacterium]|nr:lysophospholipase [Anaerolineae bacterium]